MDALEIAAYDSEDRKLFRQAFGYWNQLIEEYGSYVSAQQLELWEIHRSECAEKMH